MTIFYFPQLDHEPLHIYWDRLVSFITQPGCYVEIWEICHMIYDGVDDATRATIEGSCKGMFNYMPYEERWELLKLLAQNSEEIEMRRMAETMKNMMQSLMVQFQKSDQATDASIKRLKTQVAQLAANEKTRQPDQIPSQPDSLHNTTDAIILRSETSYKGPDSPPKTSRKEAVLVEDETELILEAIEKPDQHVTEPIGTKGRPIGLSLPGEIGHWSAEVAELEALLYAGEQIPETMATAGLTVEDEMEPMLEEAERTDWYAVEPIGTNYESISITNEPIGTKFKTTCISVPEKNTAAAKDIIVPSYADKLPFPNHQPSFPRKRYKLKGSFTLVQYASVIPWHYLCFCLAHAQFFDRLLRALSCFDYGHWRVTAF